MRKVNAVIERASDGTYSIYSDADDLNYLITGTGNSVEEAKKCFADGYTDMKRYYEENGKPFEEVEMCYVYDVQEQRIAERLGEITDMVSMAYIAKTYFKKSRSWLTHKLNGNIVNGKPAQFTDEELNTLRFALNDMSNKLNSVSATL